MLKYALCLLLAAPASASDFPLASIKAAALPPAEAAPVPAPAPADKAGYIQMTSSIKLKVDRENGEFTVGFPKVEFGGGGTGDKALLFVRMTRGLPAPSVSWATVLCSGGKYLGYKGSNIDLPEKSGSFSVSETLAMGEYPRRLIERTHPWLAGGLGSLDELCGAAFAEKMKDYRAETLPRQLGDFAFEYNSRRGSLKVTW